MPRFTTLLALCALIAFQPNARAADGRKLTLEDGDRVLLIGDVLMERENNYGVLETKMRQEFPGKKFAVRNLGYSGDTPLGASRASFDPVAKGVEQLEEQLAVVERELAAIGGSDARLVSDEGTECQQGGEAGHDRIGRRIQG
jgi:hypothetical protein